MIILAIENSEGLKKIELHYDGLKPLTFNLPNKNESVFIGKTGQVIPNEIPTSIIIKEQDTDPCINTPVSEQQQMDVENLAFNICREVKKKRQEIKPRSIARRAVEKIMPKLSGRSKNRLIDRVRHAIMAEIQQTERSSDKRSYRDIFTRHV